MSYSIQCSHCRAVLKSTKPVRAGKKLTCPKCQRPFTAENNEPKPAQPPNPIPAVLSEDDEMDAAIAKLEAEQAAAKPTPAPAPKPKPVPAPIEEVDVAEVDDELVEPESKERSPPKKKRKPSVADELEDKRRPKQKRTVDDDEDDEKQRLKKKNAESDDEDDDEPRSNRKRTEDDEAHRSKKKPEDEDDDDDDERPRAKKAKKSSSSMMLIGMVGGGLLVLLLCFGCGVGSFFLSDRFLAPDVVGKWENTEFVKLVYEFRADGTGSMNAGLRFNFRYRQEGNKLSLQPIGIDNVGGVNVNAGNELHYRVRREGDTLFLLDEREDIDIRLSKIP